MPLTFTLAFRNLFHDRLRLVATVIGIVFSIVLVMVQMGLYLGFGRMVTTMSDNASADLWVMPKGTKCFEDPSLLDTRQRSRALAVPGVGEAIPVVIGFADWRTPAGSSTPVFVVGSDLRSGGLQPWNLVEGRVESLSTPSTLRGLLAGDLIECWDDSDPERRTPMSAKREIARTLFAPDYLGTLRVTRSPKPGHKTAVDERVVAIPGE